MLSQHNEMNRKRSELQKICKHTPEMNYAKSNVEILHLKLFIYLFGAICRISLTFVQRYSSIAEYTKGDNIGKSNIL